MRRNPVRFRVHDQHMLRASIIDQFWNNRVGLLVAVTVLLLLTLWSYWPIAVDLSHEWRTNDDYSVGLLVPLIAVFLVWRERRLLRQCLWGPSWWGGISLLLLGEISRTYSVLSVVRPSAERYALVITVAGLVLMAAGWQVFRRVLWILLFLFLMVPLPGRVHNLISGPLQSIATTGSVFLLEAFGATVSQQGNIVILNEATPMAVAEACSGLRMLMAFVIVAAFVAYMVRRPRWQKAVLLLLSIPVAVACNVLRLCVTAVLFMLVSAEVGQKFFHDFAGLAMMPAAALLLFAELWLMDKLIVPEADARPEHARSRVKSAGGDSGKQVKRGKQDT